MAVLHEGRVKPLDTVAREEVKQIYGRETIKLMIRRTRSTRSSTPKLWPESRQPSGPSQSWGPVGAFLGWSVVPEFWDDQPFILVDYLPLRR